MVVCLYLRTGLQYKERFVSKESWAPAVSKKIDQKFAQEPYFGSIHHRASILTAFAFVGQRESHSRSKVLRLLPARVCHQRSWFYYPGEIPGCFQPGESAHPWLICRDDWAWSINQWSCLSGGDGRKAILQRFVRNVPVSQHEQKLSWWWPSVQENFPSDWLFLRLWDR